MSTSIEHELTKRAPESIFHESCGSNPPLFAFPYFPTNKLNNSHFLWFVGKHDDMGCPDTTVTHKAPIGPMTRSRAKAIQDKVNSLLSLHQFNISMNGLLPQADMLCVLRYDPDVDLSVGKGIKEGEGHEDGEPAAEQEEEEVKREVKKAQETKTAQTGTTGSGEELPAARYYRPTTGKCLC